jgi:hypothetical protein
MPEKLVREMSQSVISQFLNTERWTLLARISTSSNTDRLMTLESATTERLTELDFRAAVLRIELSSHLVRFIFLTCVKLEFWVRSHLA